MQINRPHGNPDLRQFIRFDPDGGEARSLSALTAAVLRPKHPHKAECKTASDILLTIRRIHNADTAA